MATVLARGLLRVAMRDVSAIPRADASARRHVPVIAGFRLSREST
jgi:hypothetical protein